VFYGKLQSQFDSLSDYFKDWKIRINPTRTQAIFFTSPRMLPASNLTLNNQVIPWSSKVKYLGLNIHKRITFATHTAKAIGRTEEAFGFLYLFLNRKSKLCIHNKLLLFETCIRSILCYYGVYTWFDCGPIVVLLVRIRTRRNYKLFRINV
jgi:hypothetical protein